MEIEKKIGTPADHNKPFKFEGLHFKRWKQKMFFYLKLMKLHMIVSATKPEEVDPPTEDSQKNADKWTDDDFD